MSDATAEYRAEQDVLAAFLTDECTVNPNLTAKSSQLYQRYTRWTEGCGESPITKKTFGLAMTERGFERYTNNGTHYRGLGLRAGDNDQYNKPY